MKFIEKLFGEQEATEKERNSAIISIPCDLIRPNRSQPRADFNQDALMKLAGSIKRYGILQPLVVKRSESDDIYEYELIAGERRLRAAQLAGLYYLPCTVIEADPERSAELAMIENLMREDLNMFEIAYGFRNLIEDLGISQEEIARKMSISQSNVANKLRLLRLSHKEQQAILALSLTERHARALLKLEDSDLRLSTIYRIADLELNVSETEEYIESLTKSAPPLESKRHSPSQTPNSIVKSIQKRLDSFNKLGKEAKMDIDSKDDVIVLHITIPK